MGGVNRFENYMETVSHLKDKVSLLNFDLEDKVSLLMGSIDKLRIPLACMRRRLRAGGKKARVWEKFLKKIFKNG